MVCRAVNCDEGRIQAAGASALAGVGWHDTHLDINLSSQSGNAALHQRRGNRLKAYGLRCAKIRITTLLLAAGENCGGAKK